MAYEIFLLPVPAGGDVEEAGEALLARLVDGHEHAAAGADSERLARQFAALDPGLERVTAADGALELRSRTGIAVTLAARFARFLVPFAYEGETARTAFERLFALLAAAARATGWRPYDPQEGAAIGLDDGSREATLEIYLSVMDQLQPGKTPGLRAAAPPA